MSDVERLFRQFTEADRAGGPAPDPLDWVARAEGAEREELIVLIEEYLTRAPRRAFDADAFAGSPARALAEDLGRVLDGDAGTWPALLPRLRHRARLSRAQLVARLADRLGVPGQEPAVLGYYHAMEQGTLPAAGVTDRVLEALGGIVGESAAALRAAGAGLAADARAGGADAAFARVARPGPSFAVPAPAAAGPPPASPGTTGAAPDETATVIALFTGRRSG